jgi:hypothetical protein
LLATGFGAAAVTAGLLATGFSTGLTGAFAVEGFTAVFGEVFGISLLLVLGDLAAEAFEGALETVFETVLAVVFFAVVFDAVFTPVLTAVVLAAVLTAAFLPVLVLTADVLTALLLAAVRDGALERADFSLRLAAADFTPLATLFLRVFCDTACAWTATPLFDVAWQDSSRHKRAWLGPAQECAENSTFPAKINDLCEFVTSSCGFGRRIVEQG